MVRMYFSGAENTLRYLSHVYEMGYNIKGLMLSFFKIKDSASETAQLKYLRRRFDTNIMIDSGAHSLLFAYGAAQRANSTWHKLNVEAMDIIKNNAHDKYFDIYYRWLKYNREAYNWAVELDIQGIVGNDKVNEWRRKMLDDEIPTIFVIHTDAGDNEETLHKWAEMGCKYVGIGGFNENNPYHIKLLHEAKNLGLKLHLFAYGKAEVYDKFPFVDSIDSTGFVMGSKFGETCIFQNGTIKKIDIRSNIHLIERIIREDPFFDLYGKEKVLQNVLKRNVFTSFNLYNLIQSDKYFSYMEEIHKSSKNNGEWW